MMRFAKGSLCAAPARLLFVIFEKVEILREPMCGRRLNQNCHQNGDKRDRRNDFGTRRFDAEQQRHSMGHREPRAPRMRSQPR